MIIEHSEQRKGKDRQSDSRIKYRGFFSHVPNAV